MGQCCYQSDRPTASLRRDILVTSEQESENFKLYFTAIKAKTDDIGVATWSCVVKEKTEIQSIFS